MFLFLSRYKHREHYVITTYENIKTEVLSMEKIYLLDKFLTVQYLKELVKNNGLKIVNPPPQELEETLKYYKQRLRSSLDEPYIMNDHQKAKVRIPLNQDEYYCMEWNMTKLKYLIKRAQIKKWKSQKRSLLLLSRLIAKTIMMITGHCYPSLNHKQIYPC